jgi:TrkA domain protein
MEPSSDPTPIPLPGVGARLEVTDADGAAVQIVRRRSGHVELHSGDHVVELDPLTASVVGAFISGHFRLRPETAQRLADVLGGLTIDWVRLGKDDAAVGRTIEELAVRRRTGVTIVAVLRGSVPLVAPDPSVRLEARDDLVVACREEDLEGFVRYMARGA